MVYTCCVYKKKSTNNDRLIAAHENDQVNFFPLSRRHGTA